MSLRAAASALPDAVTTADETGLDRATIDALADTLCVIDATGRIVAVNRAWSQFAVANGGSAARVGPGANYLDVCDAGRDSSPTAADAGDGIRAVLLGIRDVFALEYPCHGPECDRWFVMRVTRRALGAGAGAVVMHTDVTERRAATEALRAERDFVDTVLDTTRSLLLVLDENGRVVRFNRACEEVSGRHAGEVQGRSVWALGLVPDDERAAAEQAMADVLAGRGPVTLESHWQRRGGSLRRLAWTVARTPLAAGVPVYLVASAIDVTAERAAALRERERLDALARLHRLHTAGELAAMLAHELNQPLAAIANFAEASRRQIASEPPRDERLSRLVQAIAEQALRAGRSIRELRQCLARTSELGGKADADEVIRSAHELTAGHAEARGVEIHVEPAVALLAIATSAETVEHILVNLIRNAVEAIAASGPVGGRVDVRARRAGGFIRISVADNGPGFDVATAEQVFTPFYTTKPAGLGLGLHISRSLAESVGGRLWAEPGANGACFHLELPAG
jgi:two-component system CheB/CheR fusion protein